jgi:hypothetical protein
VSRLTDFRATKLQLGEYQSGRVMPADKKFFFVTVIDGEPLKIDVIP